MFSLPLCDSLRNGLSNCLALLVENRLGILKKGKGKMPPAVGLSEKDLKELVGTVKGLSKGK